MPSHSQQDMTIIEEKDNYDAQGEGEKESSESESSAKQQHPLMHLIGPAYARRKEFWISILYSSIPQGVVMGAIALAFFNVFHELSKATWLSHDYEAALHGGEDDGEHGGNNNSIEMLKIGNGEWWYVGLLAGAGACVGLTKVLWTATFQNHPFPEKPPSLLQELKELRAHDALVSIPVIICSALGLGLGASHGPEAALGAVGTALGSGFVAHRYNYLQRQWKRLRFGSTTTSAAVVSSEPDNSSQAAGELAPYLYPDFSDEEQLCALDGMAGAFGALFPSQYLSVMMIHEIGFLWEEGHNYHFMETLIRTGIAASAGYALFVGLEGLTFLEQVVLPATVYELLPEINIMHMLEALILGIICGVVGLIGFLVLAMCGALGKEVDTAFNRLGDKVGLPARYLGMLMTPIVGGTLVGLLAVAAPLTLGDGADQLAALVTLRNELGADDLLVTAVCKILAVSLVLGFGFVGGQIFPLLFAGACIGAVANLWVPSIPVAVAVPSCMVAVPCAFLPALLTLTTTVSLTFALGGAATTPVFLASIMSWTTVCGLGLVQDLLAGTTKTEPSEEDDEKQEDENASNDQEEPICEENITLSGTAMESETEPTKSV